jgi:hypothetical protein
VTDRRRPWLVATPRLLAAYHAAVNRWRRRDRRDLGVVLALIALWAGAVALLAWMALPALIAGCRWVPQHALALDVAAFGAALVLVSRRRAVVRADAARSWLAALGVARGPAYIESRALELAPALLSLTVVVIGCGSLLGVATLRGVGGLHGLLKTIGTLAAAMFFGALSSYLIPPGRDDDLPPGSRYVPHRRRAGPLLPRASLASLGHWPLRRLFASLRPKVVTRAVVPVLLAVPLGATADAALLILGLAATSAALLLLIVSIHDVSRESYRWLQPVPLRAALLRRAVLGRALLAFAVLSGLWGDLVWVAGTQARDAIQRGLALGFLCTALAVSVSWFATRRQVPA